MTPACILRLGSWDLEYAFESCRRGSDMIESYVLLLV